MTRREIGLLAAGLSGGVFAGFVAATILLAPAAELPHPQQPTPAHSCDADEVSDECPGWIDWYVDDWEVYSTNR